MKASTWNRATICSTIRSEMGFIEEGVGFETLSRGKNFEDQNLSSTTRNWHVDVLLHSPL